LEGTSPVSIAGGSKMERYSGHSVEAAKAAQHRRSTTVIECFNGERSDHMRQREPTAIEMGRPMASKQEKQRDSTGDTGHEQRKRADGEGLRVELRRRDARTQETAGVRSNTPQHGQTIRQGQQCKDAMGRIRASAGQDMDIRSCSGC
jgi:hypothetical protein